MKSIPLIQDIKTYTTEKAKADLIAGLTVGIMLIPQGMAYAMIAGLPPIYGLYASVIPLMLYALLGTSRQLAVGPVAMISLLVASGIGQIASEGSVEYITLALLLSFMVGIIQFFLGLIKSGKLVNLLPHSMIAGFTTGAALIIISSQLKSIFGLNIPRTNLLNTINHIIHEFDQIHSITTLIAISTIFILYGMKKLKSSFPTPLFLIILSIVLVGAFNLDVKGISIIGEIPSGLPHFSMIHFSNNHIISLLPTAMIIAVIGYMESIAVAKSIHANGKDYQLDNNQELVALGLSNIVGSFFQSYPTTGGFSRTAVNDQAGARTGFSSIVSSILIVMTLLFLTSYFYYLPLALLAAIIVVAVSGLIDIGVAKHLFKHDKQGFSIFALTALSTVLVNVEHNLINLYLKFVM